MVTLICLRHGETELNRQRRWQGLADEPLNATGRAQALAARPALDRERLDLVVTSNLHRAIETADLALGERALERRVDAAWREVDAGSWTGLDREEAQQRHPEGWARYAAGGTGWDDGETYAELQERVLAAAYDLARTVPENARVLVVCHAGTIRGLAAAAVGVDAVAARRAFWRSDYLAATTFSVRRSRIVLQRYNVPLVVGEGDAEAPD